MQPELNNSADEACENPAKAIFDCKSNSHPFQERDIPILEPVKIGRSVARSKPTPNNAIFDCKVLSRNHALLWYENGKFLLQDTKSSNGTFVNNQRLSKGSEESVPHVIFSKDTVQFGVDVVENQRRVTHGCIIARITLFFPNGTEALPGVSPARSLSSYSMGHSISIQHLYKLSQYLDDATHREQMLENKLATLQRIIEDTQEASENSWQALIDEDRLLSRLEAMESQLSIYSKNQCDDGLKKDLEVMHQKKQSYELTAKDTLRRALQEKLEAVGKLSDLERCFSNSEDECEHLKSALELSQNELQELGSNYTVLQKEMELCQSELKTIVDKDARNEVEFHEFKMKVTEERYAYDQTIKTTVVDFKKCQNDNQTLEGEITALKIELSEIRDDNMKRIASRLDDVKLDMVKNDVQDPVIENIGCVDQELELVKTEEPDAKKSLDTILKFKTLMLDAQEREEQSDVDITRLQQEVIDLQALNHTLESSKIELQKDMDDLLERFSNRTDVTIIKDDHDSDDYEDEISMSGIDDMVELVKSEQERHGAHIKEDISKESTALENGIVDLRSAINSKSALVDTLKETKRRCDETLLAHDCEINVIESDIAKLEGEINACKAKLEKSKVTLSDKETQLQLCKRDEGVFVKDVNVMTTGDANHIEEIPLSSEQFLSDDTSVDLESCLKMLAESKIKLSKLEEEHKISQMSAQSREQSLTAELKCVSDRLRASENRKLREFNNVHSEPNMAGAMIVREPEIMNINAVVPVFIVAIAVTSYFIKSFM